MQCLNFAKSGSKGSASCENIFSQVHVLMSYQAFSYHAGRAWTFGVQNGQSIIFTGPPCATHLQRNIFPIIQLAMQVESRRRSRALLGLNDTVNVVLELEGSSPAAALSINQDLGNSVFGGNLQVCFGKTIQIANLYSINYIKQTRFLWVSSGSLSHSYKSYSQADSLTCFQPY